MSVPCGQCMGCRINKGRIWSARILMEQAFNPRYSYFYTFTYAEPCLHYVTHDDELVSSLEKGYFLKWLNNAQKEIGAFRYYAVGEYGDDTFRPHYHVAIFPSVLCQVDKLGPLWKKGFYSVSELTATRARYLSNYTAKKLTKDTDERLRYPQEPEFRTSSRRPPLGAACVDSLVLKYREAQAASLIEERGDVERTIRLDGKIYPLGGWVLSTLRKKLKIPALHRDRIAANPNYLEYHESQEAIFEEWEHTQQEKLCHATKKRRHKTGESQKV